MYKEKKVAKKIKPEFLLISREQFLINEAKVEDVEANSTPKDPLDRTPNIPFGHLNLAWLQFKSQMMLGDRLMNFRAPEGSTYGEYGDSLDGEVSGYAITRNGKIISEFIYESY